MARNIPDKLKSVRAIEVLPGLKRYFIPDDDAMELIHEGRVIENPREITSLMESLPSPRRNFTLFVGLKHGRGPEKGKEEDPNFLRDLVIQSRERIVGKRGGASYVIQLGHSYENGRLEPETSAQIIVYAVEAVENDPDTLWTNMATLGFDLMEGLQQRWIMWNLEWDGKVESGAFTYRGPNQA